MTGQNSKLSIAAWCLYNWASDSFSIIVTTFIFATYFTTKISENEIVGTYHWANAASIAGVIIALCSPLFGAIADYGGHHKRWLFMFTLLSIVSAGLLWFAYPNPSYVYYTLICFIAGTVGLEIALVFYNAYLPQLVSNQYLGRVSGWGWGSGYLGGIFALALALVLFVQTNVFSLNTNTFAQIRICGPFVALWFGLFSIPFFLLAPVKETASRPLREAVGLGARDLWATLKKLPKEKNIFIYLIAHMIYTDGLNTLFAFGGIYAAGTYGLSFEEVLIFGITMNVTAGIGAVSLAWMDDFLGSKPTVFISLIFLTIFGIPLLFLKQKYLFWGVALCLCVFVGPVQSASRSLMARLIVDRSYTTEMFGLYALSGRITSFIGPWVLGMLTLYFDSQRVGMATVFVFFIVGALHLLPVSVSNEQKAV